MNSQNEKKESNSDDFLKELVEMAKAGGVPIGTMIMASQNKGEGKKYAHDEEVNPIVGDSFSSGWPINNNEDK